MKQLIYTIPLTFACSEAVAEKLVGDTAEEILTEGNILFISIAPNDSGYRALAIHEDRVFECTVAVIETVGFERLAVVCIGRERE